MAEPLISYAELGISQKGFRAWLAMPFASGQSRAVRSIDCLVEFLMEACGIGTGNCLLCRYDKADKQLRFALYMADGSTAASRDASGNLQHILLSALLCLPKNRKNSPLLATNIITHWPAETHSCNSDVPGWLMEWLECLPLGEGILTQSEWLDHEILELIASIDMIATASPENPSRIGWLYTDGVHVFADVAGKTILTEDPASLNGQRMEFTEPVQYVLEGAIPQKMRALADAYYTDGNILWYCNIFSGNAPQALDDCRGNVPTVYRFSDADISTLITMGDRAWSEAYDDTRPPHERLYVKCTDIDGASFARNAGMFSFSDRLRHYRLDMRTGLQLQLSQPDES